MASWLAAAIDGCAQSARNGPIQPPAPGALGRAQADRGMVFIEVSRLFSLDGLVLWEALRARLL
jgi:hypothetical protein